MTGAGSARSRRTMSIRSARGRRWMAWRRCARRRGSSCTPGWGLSGVSGRAGALAGPAAGRPCGSTGGRRPAASRECPSARPGMAGGRRLRVVRRWRWGVASTWPRRSMARGAANHGARLRRGLRRRPRGKAAWSLRRRGWRRTWRPGCGSRRTTRPRCRPGPRGGSRGAGRCPRPALEALAAIADELRREAVGDDVTYVVNRNINFTNVCYTGCRFCAFAQREGDPDAFTLPLPEVGRRVDEAVAAGPRRSACRAGFTPAARDRLLRPGARGRRPRVHVRLQPHGGQQRRSEGSDVGAGLAGRGAGGGLGSIPGTAAEILDDDIRWVLTKGKLPTADWLSVIGTAHEVGLPSSSTMMYGHVDAPQHWLPTCARCAGCRSGPADSRSSSRCPSSTTTRRSTSPELRARAVAGGRRRGHRAGARAAARSDPQHPGLVGEGRPAGHCTAAGGRGERHRRDAHGETISRMAGSGFGSALTPEQLRGIAAMAGRPARQRTTTYGVVEAGPGPDSVPRESDARTRPIRWLGNSLPHHSGLDAALPTLV